MERKNINRHTKKYIYNTVEQERENRKRNWTDRENIKKSTGNTYRHTQRVRKC